VAPFNEITLDFINTTATTKVDSGTENLGYQVCRGLSSSLRGLVNTDPY
jgi:hypothetical protein